MPDAAPVIDDAALRDRDAPILGALGRVFTRREWLAFAAAVAVLMVAKLRAFGGWIHAPDDLIWLPVPFSYELLHGIALPRGHLLQPAVAEVFLTLGFNVHRAPTFGAIALVLAQASAATLACRLWGLMERPVAAAVVVAFACLFPYQVDIYVSRGMAPFSALGLILPMAGLALIDGRTPRAVLATALIAAGLMLDQVGYAQALVVALGAIAFDGLRQPPAAAWRGHGARFGALFAALAIYVMAIAIVFRAVGLPGGDLTAMLDVARWPAAYNRAVMIVATLAEDRRLLAPLVCAALVAVALVLILSTLLSARRLGIGRSVLTLIALAMTFVAALSYAAIAGSISFGDVSAIGLAWGAVTAMAILLSPPWLARGVAVAAGAACLGFIGVNNEILGNIDRMHHREAAIANRIVQRVEELDVDGRVRYLVVVGRDDGPIWELRTIAGRGSAPRNGHYDLGVGTSVLAHGFGEAYPVALINEYTGRHFNQTLPAGLIFNGRAYCRRARPWPAPDSIAIEDDVAFVCLTPP